MSTSDTLDLNSLRRNMPAPVPSIAPEPTPVQALVSPAQTAGPIPVVAPAAPMPMTASDVAPAAPPIDEATKKAFEAAAAAARARIQKAPETEYELDLSHYAPTAEIVTKKEVLVKKAKATPQVQPKRKMPSIVSPILTAIGTFVIILLLFKAPIIYSQLTYHPPSTTTTAPKTATSTNGVPIIPKESTVTIAKLNVHAPIIYEPSYNETTIQKDLEGGVVHYANTAVPGQAGNVAIFGHSSNDWWEPGNYKFVFVLLDKLVAGDKITVDYQSKRYTYEVTGNRVVEPTDLSVLAPTASPTLSLITCTPPGTSWKRLVVTAKQVDPVPGAQDSPTPSAELKPDNSSASAKNTGFWDGFSHLFDGLWSGLSAIFNNNETVTIPGQSTPTSTPDSLPVIK